MDVLTLFIKANLCFSFRLFLRVVLKYIDCLGINKATCLDGTPSRFIKDGSPIIVSPSTHITNLSLIQGGVSDDLKSA